MKVTVASGELLHGFKQRVSPVKQDQSINVFL